MILYFSGTGNSRYVAQMIGKATGDKVVSINELMKDSNKQQLDSETPYVFLFPIYAGRMPRVVEAFIQQTQFSGSKAAYFIATCGVKTNGLTKYAVKLCKETGFQFMGYAPVVMPANYVALYNPTPPQQAEERINQAEPKIMHLAKLIQQSRPLPQLTPMGSFLVSMVNSIFYARIIGGKGFYSTQACNSCGNCAKLCPLNNIQLVEGKPQWGNHCTHCMACISGCPQTAIEYKNKTQGRRRYFMKNTSAQ